MIHTEIQIIELGITNYWSWGFSFNTQMSLQHSHKFASPHDNYDYSSSITIISKVFLALCDMCAGVITPIYSFVFALRNTLPPLPRRHHQGNLDQSLSLMTVWPLAWPATVMEPTTTSTQAFRSASESFADCVSFFASLISKQGWICKMGETSEFPYKDFSNVPQKEISIEKHFFLQNPRLIKASHSWILSQFCGIFLDPPHSVLGKPLFAMWPVYMGSAQIALSPQTILASILTTTTHAPP